MHNKFLNIFYFIGEYGVDLNNFNKKKAFLFQI